MQKTVWMLLFCAMMWIFCLASGVYAWVLLSPQDTLTRVDILLLCQLLVLTPFMTWLFFWMRSYRQSVRALAQTLDLIEGIDDLSMQCDVARGGLAPVTHAVNQMLLRLRGLQQKFTELENTLLSQKNQDATARNWQIQQTLEKYNTAQAQLAKLHQSEALGRVAIDFILASGQNDAFNQCVNVLSTAGEKQRIALDLPLAKLVEVMESAYPHIGFEKEYALSNTPIVCHLNDVLYVVLAILSNAVQSIAKKGTITISTAKVYEQAIISISDTGEGMPRNILDTIFTPYFTTRQASNAAGLGLSTSVEIIQQHGGTLTVESKKQQGTRVIIALPFEENVK